MARISDRCRPHDVEVPRSGKGETLYLSYNEHRKYISRNTILELQLITSALPQLKRFM